MTSAARVRRALANGARTFEAIKASDPIYYARGKLENQQERNRARVALTDMVHAGLVIRDGDNYHPTDDIMTEDAFEKYYKDKQRAIRLRVLGAPDDGHKMRSERINGVIKEVWA